MANNAYFTLFFEKILSIIFRNFKKNFLWFFLEIFSSTLMTQRNLKYLLIDRMKNNIKQ